MRASHFIYIVVALTAFAATDLRFNRDNALADSSQGIQLNPKLVDAYYRRGVVCFLKGDLEDALADFNQADPAQSETDRRVLRSALSAQKP